MKKVVMYINQFFGQIGGEEKAGIGPQLREGPVGPAVALNGLLQDAQITHTIICGDNYMGEKIEQAAQNISDLLSGIPFDLFIAGPAFQAGRYGVACGQVCKAVEKMFHVPAITSMHIENPGVEMFKKDIYILQGSHSSARMRKDLAALAALANKILLTGKAGSAQEDGFYPRGIRHQVIDDSLKPAADRCVEMIIQKLGGQSYQTELPISLMEPVPIAPAISDLSKATIALLTTGGIVPVDNPDHIQSASATRWGRYSIEGMERLESGVYKTIHAGFDPAAANADPNVIAPVDALRQYEREGKLKRLHPYFYSTVGTGTTQAEAQRMAKEILPYLQQDHVDGVLMVST